MTLISKPSQKFEHEAQTTRKHFERPKDDKFDWRPHAKSFTAVVLAAHIVECIRWGDSILTLDQPWRLKVQGRTMFEKTKEGVFRDLVAGQ